MNIKGFDRNLCCRDMQFEVGKTYNTGAKDEELELCSNTVYHYCKSLEEVHEFYNVRADNRFCEIEVLGAEITDGHKYGSNKIKIVREIVGVELDQLKGLINNNAGTFNTGTYNSGNRNTGDHNSGSFNSGDYNSGYYNSGSFNSGDYNDGSFNSGDCNTGNRNTGNYNSGDCNSGFFNRGGRNSGSRNSGSFNSGDYNSGDYNSGFFNSCDFSNGVFCTQDPKITIFNAESNMTMSEFLKSKYYKAITSSPFVLIEWNNCEHLHEARSYKEACAKWWEGMTNENKQIIMSMPNFSKEVFKEITGIEV